MSDADLGRDSLQYQVVDDKGVIHSCDNEDEARFLFDEVLTTGEWSGDLILQRVNLLAEVDPVSEHLDALNTAMRDHRLDLSPESVVTALSMAMRDAVERGKITHPEDVMVACANVAEGVYDFVRHLGRRQPGS